MVRIAAGYLRALGALLFLWAVCAGSAGAQHSRTRPSRDADQLSADVKRQQEELLDQMNRQTEAFQKHFEKLKPPFPTNGPQVPLPAGSPRLFGLVRGMALQLAIVAACTFLVLVGGGVALYLHYAPKANPQTLAEGDPQLTAELARCQAAAQEEPGPGGSPAPPTSLFR
jgi:hypothetical protein